MAESIGYRQDLRNVAVPSALERLEALVRLCSLAMEVERFWQAIAFDESGLAWGYGGA